MEIFSCLSIGICSIFLICLALACVIDSFQKPVEIEGKHVLVTGGSSGIGKEVAKEAVRMGANVTIVARNAQKLENTLKELKDLAKDGQKVAQLSIDISSGTCQEIRQMVEGVIQELGPIKVWSIKLTGQLLLTCLLSGSCPLCRFISSRTCSSSV